MSVCIFEKKFIFLEQKIHYLQTDEKKKKILIAHANGYSAYCYKYLIEYLAKDYQVFAMDFVGHGKSQGHLSLPDYKGWLLFRNQILAFIEHKKLEKVIGIGHSLGGGSMILAGKKNPEKFEKIIALDPVVLNYFAIGYSKVFQVPLAKMAIKRRRTFKSIKLVEKAYKRSPAFSNWNKDVYQNYLSSCFRPTGNKEEVELCLDPAIEAKIFNAVSFTNLLWRHRNNKVEIHIITPKKSEVCPSKTAKKIMKGNKKSSLTQNEQLTHFFPFENIEYTKEIISAKLK